MNHYLSKPVNQRDLAAMLVKYFSCQPENGIPNETKPTGIKKWRLLLADDDPDDFLLLKKP